MPTYEYRRPDGSTFEVFQKMSADPLTHDPETGAPVRRVISGGAGLQFKGDGFYVTDYVRKGTKGGENASSSGESGDSTSTSSESTSPPSTSSESKPSSSSSDSASD